MPHSAAPYPTNLKWRHVLPRLFILNQVLVLVGAFSLYMTEFLASKSPSSIAWLYYFVWMQCVALSGFLITGNAMLLMARRRWRQLPDAAERYARLGLYQGLPTAAKWQLVVTSIGGLLLSVFLAQHLFEFLLSSRLGVMWLPQVPPAFKLTVFNASYGTLIIYVYEYFQDRSARSEAREKMARELSAQAQLNLLRSQLDPHMLFNTLSNLDELIDENPEQAHAMLAHLIGFLRSTLVGSRVAQHALADEFKLASDYLSLMQIRMGDRLQASLKLPAELSDTQIPAMLLQPLVENAIKHGLETRKDGGLLNITAHTQAGDLVLQVSNSCASDHQVDNNSSGFGLHYVRDRLQALYGEAANLHLQHQPDQNLTVLTLRMPLQATAPRSAT